METAETMLRGIRSSPSAHQLPILHLKREQLLRFESALACEWLVTNGLGGYASGTPLGIDTRRYHGLLFAALHPPVGRTLLLARVHETIQSGDDDYSLTAAEYHDGTIHPAGHIFLQEFHLEGTLPVWRYRCRDVEVEKTLWLEHGRNTLFLRYRLLAASGRVRLRLEPFPAHRDLHSHTRGDLSWRFQVEVGADGCRVQAFSEATPLWLKVAGGRFIETGLWYWRFLHRKERERDFDALEDLYTPGVFGIDLAPGESATLVATIHPEDLSLDPETSHQMERTRQAGLLRQAGAEESDPVRQQLVLAADRFLCRPGPQECAVLAGYHWFTERPRDSAISLPGLCLATGRYEEARALLATLVRRLEGGLLPNTLPESGTSPQDVSADASLWLFEALARYERATGDEALVDQLLPALEEVVACYRRGTRHGIGVDPEDGLLRASCSELPLTWMDATVDGRPVTPRQGKPVELQALWYNALCLLAGWRARRGREVASLAAEAELCRISFNQRFWDPGAQHCLDVVDGPGDDSAAFRPNQLLAASLTHAVLDPAFCEPMLSQVESHLLTPAGLRGLAPGQPGYQGIYGGAAFQRDRAYHQGTVWPWLLGPYWEVARRVRGAVPDPASALARLADHATGTGMGIIPEVFDGDPPHASGGCIARAWNVAELLRLWPTSDE